MPYTKDNPPDRIKGLPKHAQEIWISTFNNAIKEYDGDEEKANATAWAAVKKAGYKKNEDGKWVKMADETFKCECIECGHKITSKEHCANLKCSKCGGQMRREGRPGPGQYGDEPNFDEVPIFVAGTYPQGDVSEAQLDEIIANFDPSYHEPPVTKDHIQDGKAHGWIEKIWRVGKTLYAKMREISKELLEDIKTGAYKKRSIELWDDFEETGKLVLKAVTWLGARPPQVKGMPNVFAYGFEAPHGHVTLFSDMSELKITGEEKNAQKTRSANYGISIIEGGHVTKPTEWSSVTDDQWGDPVNFSYPCSDAKQTEAALKYWAMPRNKGRYSDEDQRKITERLGTFAEKFNLHTKTLKPEEHEMNEQEVKAMVDGALKKQGEELTAKFSEDIKKLTEKNDQLEKDIKEKEKDFADKQKAVRVDALIGGLLKDRKILPALKDAGLREFMLGLDDEKVIEFGENKKSMIDWITEVFGQKLPGIDFGEFAKTEDKQTTSVLAFKVMDEKDKKNFVDKDSLDLNEKATAYAEKHKVSFKEALLTVSVQ